MRHGLSQMFEGVYVEIYVKHGKPPFSTPEPKVIIPLNVRKHIQSVFRKFRIVSNVVRKAVFTA